MRVITLTTFIITTRTALSEALIVSGEGYDADGPCRRPRHAPPPPQRQQLREVRRQWEQREAGVAAGASVISNVLVSTGRAQRCTRSQLLLSALI